MAGHEGGATIPPPEADDLIGLDAYRERFGVSVATARRHARDVEGLAWVVDGRLMFSASAAERRRAERAAPRPAWRAAKEAGA